MLSGVGRLCRIWPYLRTTRALCPTLVDIILLLFFSIFHSFLGVAACLWALCRNLAVQELHFLKRLKDLTEKINEGICNQGEWFLTLVSWRFFVLSEPAISIN